MNKRLRKKKRVGEFKVLGANIAITLKDANDFEAFIDAFLLEAVEANGCWFGGGGKETELSGFIVLGLQQDAPEKRLASISDWLPACSMVADYKVGNLTDAWYGPFEEV